jgi:ACR3 family arsenite efflux pump ArsB
VGYAADVGGAVHRHSRDPGADAAQVVVGKKGEAAFDATMAKIGPWSISALLVTLVLLFAFQGEAILKQPLVIALLAVPILIQVFFNSGTGLLAQPCRWGRSTTWPARRR